MKILETTKKWNLSKIMKKAHRYFTKYKSEGVLFCTCLKLAWDFAKSHEDKYMTLKGHDLKKEYNKYNNEDDRDRFFVIDNTIKKETDKAILTSVYCEDHFTHEVKIISEKWIAKSLLA